MIFIQVAKFHFKFLPKKKVMKDALQCSAAFPSNFIVFDPSILKFVFKTFIDERKDHPHPHGCLFFRGAAKNLFFALINNQT